MRLPSEILGYIFAWIVTPERRYSTHSRTSFLGLKKISYNFLLICRHWLEVASNTPEVWSFWGNKLRDWRKRYHRAGVASTDLVLDDYHPEVLCDPLKVALKDHAAKNKIREVH